MLPVCLRATLPRQTFSVLLVDVFSVPSGTRFPYRHHHGCVAPSFFSFFDIRLAEAERGILGKAIGSFSTIADPLSVEQVVGSFDLHSVLWGPIDPAPCGPLLSAGAYGHRRKRGKHRKVRDQARPFFEAPGAEHDVYSGESETGT